VTRMAESCPSPSMVRRLGESVSSGSIIGVQAETNRQLRTRADARRDMVCGGSRGSREEAGLKRTPRNGNWATEWPCWLIDAG
jgi:hypothetical protein